MAHGHAPVAETHFVRTPDLHRRPFALLGDLRHAGVGDAVSAQRLALHLFTIRKNNDEIVTSGGIAGRIDDVGESFIVVEIAEGTKVKLQKGAINAVLPKGTLKSL